MRVPAERFLLVSIMSPLADYMSTAYVGAPDPEIVDLERRRHRARRRQPPGTARRRSGGALVSGVYGYTLVWARDVDGQWRVVGGHVRALPA